MAHDRFLYQGYHVACSAERASGRGIVVTYQVMHPAQTVAARAGGPAFRESFVAGNMASLADAHEQGRARARALVLALLRHPDTFARTV
jgi:hypothetical protein